MKRFVLGAVALVLILVAGFGYRVWSDLTELRSDVDVVEFKLGLAQSALDAGELESARAALHEALNDLRRLSLDHGLARQFATDEMTAIQDRFTETRERYEALGAPL